MGEVNYFQVLLPVQYSIVLYCTVLYITTVLYSTVQYITKVTGRTVKSSYLHSSCRDFEILPSVSTIKYNKVLYNTIRQCSCPVQSLGSPCRRNCRQFLCLLSCLTFVLVSVFIVYRV